MQNLLTFRKLFWLCSFILTLASCKDDQIDQASGSLSLLSYNVAGLPQSISSSDPEKYMSLISPSLNDFDVVHVQEDFCYHDSLLLYLDLPYRSEPTPCIGSGLNSFSKYPIKDFERVAWTDCTLADCFSLKGFSYSKIEVAKDIYIDFYNVHCNAGSSEESKAARRKNLEQLITYMQVHSPSNAIVIMGDFNNKYIREGDSIRAFLDLGFTDAWIELIRQDDIPQMNNIPLEDCYPISTSISCEGVDKLLYRSNDEMKLKAISFQYGDDNRFFFEGNDTLPLSDHEPLMVQMSFDFNRK
ncbi:MAG: hypothetical protein KDC82_07570 [Bacteroidetes bacterium]|nr:hypothetical protein [Bacteroidota bacterium]